jgi:hypothetical protein
VWINPPPKKTGAQDAPGTTIVISDDPRVDTILVADDHAVVMLIDCGATLISSPLVSQCR